MTHTRIVDAPPIELTEPVHPRFRSDVVGPGRVDVSGWAWVAMDRRPDQRGTNEALTLLALARLTEEGLNGPDGYSVVYASAIAGLTGFAESTTRRHLAALDNLGLAVKVGRGWRVPEEVLQ